ncbi:hypothetical protein POJ06DRAFT_242454 [Lipomyces tetrasporus]|uniref:Uncharacterized protein n=1 Tax=Lipomyces tetrasporus TaxID=54092 RepID=A0AAD7VW04_9ASCO|nr:uncharacterized protein POJ06DRAFT_242454 [Lipomyces tetrasporus]KAJ8103616.1 hypothetical protein POJ06DRAFT_242454 [Lipomyces tetrasporus]
MNRVGSNVIGRLQIRQSKRQRQTWRDICRIIQSTRPTLLPKIRAQINSLLSLPSSKGSRILRSS